MKNMNLEIFKLIGRSKALSWNKNQIIEQFKKMIPDFDYEDKGKYLDGKM